MMHQQQIYLLSNQIAEKIPELLDFFDIPFKFYKNRYSFPCPVHSGDNKDACTIFTDGIPNWACWTHGCQNTYNKSLIGFVRGILCKRSGKDVSIDETAKKVCDFLDFKLQEIDFEEYNKNKKLKDFLSSVEILNRKPTRKNIEVDTGLLSALTVPSPYYIDRGYSQEILTKFGVGDCRNYREIINRAVVPIYDEENNYVGYTARTKNDKYLPKWLNSDDFTKSQFLYGLNYAKQTILETGKVFIVEGQGDVWRAHEAGFENIIGIFGANLSEDQLILLEMSGCFNIIILTDQDEPGRLAAQQIIDTCGRRFNYHVPKFDAKDIGELNIPDLQQLLGEY